MANPEHRKMFMRGVEIWNRWRKEHPEVIPDLEKIHFTKVDLRKADLHEANLRGANLREVDLSNAHLGGASLRWANLAMASLNGAMAQSVDLKGASLYKTTLVGVNLENANLSYATLVETNFSRANLTGCKIYGISAWDINLEGANQSNLIITSPEKSVVTVDNLEVAQFIYLLLNNSKIRDVINTIGQKGVLILGRFSQERKLVLDALREKLRTLNFLPIVFDFERPTERDFTETILTLAGLSCFIIADITNPSSAPLELQATVPNYMIPFVPIIQQGEKPFAMFRDLQSKYSWVLDTLKYDTSANLIKGLERAVVQPALEKRAELLATKVEQLRTRHIGEYL